MTLTYERMEDEVKTGPDGGKMGYGRVCLQQAQSVAAAVRDGDPEKYEPFLVK